MARTNGGKTQPPTQDSPVVSSVDDTEDVSLEATPDPVEADTEATTSSNNGTETHDIDEILNSLKTLLSTVEKLQKVRQEVGDIKPLIVRLLDGELVSGEDLEQLKTGINGLSRLVKVYTDHQAALTKAQPARTLLDDVLKVRGA